MLYHQVTKITIHCGTGMFYLQLIKISYANEMMPTKEKKLEVKFTKYLPNLI